MDDIRCGAVVRRVRIRLRLRQVDLGRRAGVSKSTISRIERGHLDEVSLRTLRRVAAVLEIRLDLIPRWRGGDLDRMVNARHADLHEQVAREMAGRPDWLFQPEVSFSAYGERGVIDILAFHPVRNALVVIELKTDIVDVNEIVGTMDRRVRLAPEIGARRGWPIRPGVTTSALLIVADGRTSRRRVQAHATMLRAAFPLDGRAVRGWLAKPDRAIRCVWFWPDSRGRRPGRGPAVVRRVQANSAGGNRA